jgi:hypothetical protein
MTIAAFVDAVLIVVQADTARRPVLAEMGRVLDAWPAERLGFVLCGAESFDGYSYYGYGRHSYGKERRAEERIG